MYPISQAMRDALTRPHDAIFKAELYDNGVLAKTLDVLGGLVDVDANADRRRRCRVGLVDPDGSLTPADLSGLLAPNGNELRLYRGVRVAGVEHWCPQGVFGIMQTDTVDRGQGVMLEVQGQDRSRRVARARWDQAYAIAPGTDTATAIRDIIDSRLPGLSYNFTPTSRTTPLVLLGEQRENDPWKDATKIAQADGLELFFDADGVCVLRPVPDAATAPVDWTYSEGGVLLELERQLTSDRTYNAVIVTGEGTGLTAPVRAVVMDTDPASPTYVGNPVGSSDFGFAPRFLTSALITSQQQAEDAGAAMLRSSLGASEDVRFSGVVNPAHEAGDVVEVRRGASKVDARYVLSSFGVPLDVTSPLRATTRKRTV